MAPKKDDKKNQQAVAAASSFAKREPIEPPPPPAEEDVEDPFKIPRDTFMVPFPEWQDDVVDTEEYNPTDEDNLFADPCFIRKCLPRTFQSKVAMWKRCSLVFDNAAKEEPENLKARPPPPSTPPPVADPKAKAKADPKAKAAPTAGGGSGTTTKAQFENVPRPAPGAYCVVEKAEIESRQFDLSVDDGCSPLAQGICSQILLVGEHAKFIPQGQFLWDLIFPQDESGTPLYNPNGKYCVKLFIQGAWRQVIVDDVVPVAQQAVQPGGAYIAHHVPLLPWNAGYPNAIWPLILSKAILKAFQADLKSGKFSIVTCLTGWLPLRLPMTWDTLSFYHGRSLISAVAVDSQVDMEARQNAAFAEASAALQSAEPAKGGDGKKAKVPELKLNKGKAQQPSPKLQRVSGTPYEATLQFAICEIESDPPQLRLKSSISKPVGGNLKKARPATEGEEEEEYDEDEEVNNEEEHDEEHEENEDEDDEEHRSARSPAGNENPSSARSQGAEGEDHGESPTGEEDAEAGSGPASAKASPWPEKAPLPHEVPLNSLKEFQEKLTGGFWVSFEQAAELIEAFDVYVPREAFVSPGPLETSWTDRSEQFMVAHPKLLQLKLAAAPTEQEEFGGEESSPEVSCPPLFPTVLAYEPLRPDPAMDKAPGPGTASVSCAIQNVSHWQREPAVGSCAPFINLPSGDGSSNGAMAVASLQLPAGDHWFLVIDEAIRAGSSLNVWTESSKLDTDNSVLQFVEPIEFLQQNSIPTFTPFEGGEKSYTPQKGYSIWAKAELVLGPDMHKENFQLLSYLSDPSVQPNLQLSFLRLVMQGGGTEIEQTANWTVTCLARSALVPLMTLPLGDSVDTSDGTTVKYVLVLEANFSRAIKEGTVGLQMIMPSLGAEPQQAEDGGEEAPPPVLCTPLKTEVVTRWSQEMTPNEKGTVLRERIAVPAGSGEVTATLRISVKNLPRTFLNAQLIVQLPPTQEMRPKLEGGAEPEPFKIGDNVEPKEYGGRKNWLASLRTVVSETGVEAVILPHVVFLEGVTYIISVSLDPFRGPDSLQGTADEPATWLLEAFGSGEIELGADTMEQDLEVLVRKSWEEKEADRAVRAKASREKYLQEKSGDIGDGAASQDKTEEEMAEEEKLKGALGRADFTKHLNTGAKDFVFAHTVEAPSLDAEDPYGVCPLTDIELANRQDAQDAEVQAAATEWENTHALVEKAIETNKEDLDKLHAWGEEQPWCLLQCGEKRETLRDFLLKRKDQRSALRSVIYDAAADLTALQEAWEAAVAAEVNISDPDIGQRAENKLKFLKNVGKLEDHLAKKDAEDPAATERYLDDAAVRKEVTDLLSSCHELLKALGERDIPFPEELRATLGKVSEALEDNGQSA
eukprot:gnl/MRDRNA2_/MRDRNA2_83019_c0_seq1.p1 gnl/MRDRNA2_/MRDRNA2_83019_c0~~gnl/MRDRNA2_/MRDRNA2_83019_c0_seq1.p1  ORF type:complete len:1373 (+),score=373.82 gnl/MRDRNA2_/MRDRNA2_83019_c0_seq1:96-4214(+)